jgi:predicted ATP-dependent protease
MLPAAVLFDLDGTITIDVQGRAVGQVNGLALYNFGDISFGKVTKITATTLAGRFGVTNVQQESQLSGRIHDKGIIGQSMPF